MLVSGHTSTWISHRYTCLLPLEPSSNLPLHPISRLSQSTYLSSMHHTANFHWLSFSHMVICIFPYDCLSSSHPLLSPLCLQVYSLCLHCCPANRVISTFSLDSMCTHDKLYQSCVTLCNTMDCSPPGAFVHGILQARIPESVALPSQGIFLTQGLNLRLLQLLHC